ncbi:hypothetical protein FOC29_03205 [Burkholderia vietnamiensis]|uniref:hypothetical protein n=1 Tax=Burkholderia vietnamiensis TaxID=60552 RepID=UPI001EE58F42|nr:hypothetical protein [Burkholderia vietnamiensis]UKV72826.1 hypothetical protein FOC29_03205 [Burkholderia vietnamiensis]
MKALLILWLKSLGVLIVAVLVLATTQQWDESANYTSTARSSILAFPVERFDFLGNVRKRI